MFFGKKLKELREENKLTQLEIATMLSVSKTTICQWEKHKQEPSLNDICELTNIFKVSADYLLGLEDETGAKTYENYNSGNYINYGTHNGNNIINNK